MASHSQTGRLACIATLLLVAMSPRIACAQPSNTQFLQTPKLMDRAWIIYSAMQSHDEGLGSTLTAALHDAIPLRNSPSFTEEYAYIQLLFDALIQLGTEVPPEVILPFRNGRRAEVLLLLARASGNEDALLAMLDEHVNTAEWLALSNLLWQQRSQRFFQKTLSQTNFTHYFEIKDTDQGAARCGGAIGNAMTQRRFPRGFPPIALYQLDFDQMSTGRLDGILAFPGPHDVYYRRKVIDTDAQEAWTELRFFRELDGYRSEYLALLANRPSDEVRRIFFPVSTLHWKSGEQFQQDIAAELAAQADHIRELVSGLSQCGLGDVRGLPLRISPTIYDYRKSAREPLPLIPAKEVIVE